MRSILLLIPLKGELSLGGWTVPWFGAGVILSAWLVFVLISLFRAVRQGGWQAVSLGNLVTYGIVALLIHEAPRLGDTIPVYGYGLMLFLGFYCATTWASSRLHKLGADPEIAWDVATWIFIGGIVGARLFYVIQYRDRVFHPSMSFLERLYTLIKLWDGGLVFYGGMILGAVAYWAYCRVMRLNPLALADILISSVLLGMSFGRIGCLLNGCCYGDYCELPWAVTFPAGSVPFVAEVSQGFLAADATHSLPLHPTQIYSAISSGLLALLTWAYYPYRRRNGEVLALAWICYPITRFLIEFLRGDELGQLGTMFTISQIISAGMVVAGVLFYLMISRNASRTPIVQSLPDAGAIPATTAD